MINGALDERTVDVTGGGVDLEAVDLAAAHLVTHHALVGAGIEHGQHTTARAHEDVALVLEGDGPSQPAPVEASDHQDSTGETLLWLRFSLNSPMVCVNSVSLCRELMATWVIPLSELTITVSCKAEDR